MGEYSRPESESSGLSFRSGLLELFAKSFQSERDNIGDLYVKNSYSVALFACSDLGKRIEKLVKVGLLPGKPGSLPSDFQKWALGLEEEKFSPRGQVWLKFVRSLLRDTKGRRAFVVYPSVPPDPLYDRHYLEYLSAFSAFWKEGKLPFCQEDIQAILEKEIFYDSAVEALMNIWEVTGNDPFWEKAIKEMLEKKLWDRDHYPDYRSNLFGGLRMILSFKERVMRLEQPSLPPEIDLRSQGEWKNLIKQRRNRALEFLEELLEELEGIRKEETKKALEFLQSEGMLTAVKDGRLKEVLEEIEKSAYVLSYCFRRSDVPERDYLSLQEVERKLLTEAGKEENFRQEGNICLDCFVALSKVLKSGVGLTEEARKQALTSVVQVVGFYESSGRVREINEFLETEAGKRMKEFFSITEGKFLNTEIAGKIASKRVLMNLVIRHVSCLNDSNFHCLADLLKMWFTSDEETQHKALAETLSVFCSEPDGLVWKAAEILGTLFSDSFERRIKREASVREREQVNRLLRIVNQWEAGPEAKVGNGKNYLLAGFLHLAASGDKRVPTLLSV